MDEREQRDIFTRNFRWYVDNSGKNQREIAKEMGFSYTTFNTWYRGAALPNAAKIQAIADYFHVGKSALLDKDRGSSVAYYLDPETAQIAQELHDNEDQKLLLKASQKLKPDALKALRAFVESQIEAENGYDS